VVERPGPGGAIPDCSGKSTYYRYDERQQLVAVTDALNQTATLERKPDGEVQRISHPDGIPETFTYNVYGRVLSHTDGVSLRSLGQPDRAATGAGRSG
jgi:YD repeat-containing protein